VRTVTVAFPRRLALTSCGLANAFLCGMTVALALESGGRTTTAPTHGPESMILSHDIIIRCIPFPLSDSNSVAARLSPHRSPSRVTTLQESTHSADISLTTPLTSR